MTRNNYTTITHLVPNKNCFSKSNSELLVTREDVVELVEENVHLGLGQDGWVALLQRKLVVGDESGEGGEVIVLAHHQTADDVSPLGLFRAQEERWWRKTGRRLLVVLDSTSFILLLG